MVFLLMGLNRGTQRRNVSKWIRSESNGFRHALQEWLINLELPLKLFICSDVLSFPRYELNVASARKVR